MEQTDPRIKDVFARLNRTQYALSSIEKQATEFGATEFMLVAKLLCGELDVANDDVGDGPDKPDLDPGISADFIGWASGKAGNKFRDLVLNGKIFTPYEASRKVQLQFTLNAMSTILRGNFNRNDASRDLLDEYSLAFPERDRVFEVLNKAAELISRLRLPERSIWWRKANIFTLVNVLARNAASLPTPHTLRTILDEAADNLPEEYTLAAREAVNNRKERIIRDEYVSALLARAPR